MICTAANVTAVPPHKRPVNTVFQRPSLFPHLDVGENVALSLRLAKTRESGIKRRVADALALVRLPGYERRAEPCACPAARCSAWPWPGF